MINVKSILSNRRWTKSWKVFFTIYANLRRFLQLQSAADTILSGNINIIIPPLDTRAHELYTLTNGLRVMLWSDQSSNSAAAAINLYVGSTSNPDSIPGRAHFNK